MKPICDKCHQTIRPKQPKRLFAWACDTLVLMSRTVSERRINEFTRRDLEWTKGDKLDHGAYANFTTLGKNGLIAKVFVKGRRKRGVWCITRKGYRFLTGQPVPDCVWTWEGKIVARSPIQKTIGQILRMTPYAPSLDNILTDYPEPTIDEEQLPLPTFVKRNHRGAALCPTCGKPMRTDEPGEFVKTPSGATVWQTTGTAYWVCNPCGLRVPKTSNILT